jgi:hypothetical protein
LANRKGPLHHVCNSEEDFKLEDTMAGMKMEQALAKIKLGPKKDLNKLLKELASFEC